MSQFSFVRVLASDGLPLSALPDTIEPITLAPWLKREVAPWEGVLPVCLLITQAEFAAFQHCPLSEILAQARVPVIELDANTTADTVAKLVFEQVLAGHATERRLAHELRSEAAQLRQDYMTLQQSFNVTEDFLYSAFAPRFTCARQWQMAGETLAGKTRQRLPVGSPGLVAVDIWAAGPGRARLRIMRENGAAFAPEFELEAEGEGWLRAQLEKPLSGLAEDVVIEVESDFGLGLSLPTPLTHLHAKGANAPLAMQIWKGLPGVRLPTMQPGPARFIIPASALPAPEMKGGTCKQLEGRDAIALHPGHDGKLTAVFRGVEVPSAANIAAYVQNFGPETVRLSLALSDDAQVHEAFLPPESHVQCDVDVGSPGSVDLHFKLRAPSPVVSIFIRGIEICPVPE